MKNNNNNNSSNNYNLAIIAIVAALGLLGLVLVTVAVTIPLQQQAEARGCESGFPNSFIAFNASQGRCFGH